MSGMVPYKRLQHQGDGSDGDESRSGGGGRGWRWRWRLRVRRVGARRRRVRVAGLMRRFMVRKRVRLVSAVRKVIERLKESRAHFGDLFAGNYMFLQVGPTPLKSCHHNINNNNTFSLPPPIRNRIV